MKYFLQRDGRTYGPYSYDDLKRYQAENRIGPTDQVRREDSQQWEPWQQVLNPAAAVAPTPAPMDPTPPVQPGYGGGYTPPAPQPAQPSFGQPPQQGFGSQPPAFGGGGFGQPPATPSPYQPPPEQGFGGGGYGQPQQPQGSDVPGAFGAFGAQGGFGGPPAGQQPGGFGVQQGGQPGGFGGQPGGFGGQPGGFGGQPMMPQGGGYGGGQVGPMPPDMQWWLVLIIGMLCGLFTLFWIWKQVMFVKKIDPQTTAPKFYGMGIVGIIGGYMLMFLGMAFATGRLTELAVVFPMLGMVVVLGSIVCLYIGHFKMRASIHNYYTMVEPMGINLMDTSGAILTFFFSIYFFQYHFYNIAERKKAMGHPAV
jgi:hypothetical protein